ncbi:MAG: hypothetical protein JXR76_10660 [Deltaproteobacteria bacterium]|nr:hypothetical protein [Deltaproteobacteria bacterium]
MSWPSINIGSVRDDLELLSKDELRSLILKMVNQSEYKTARWAKDAIVRYAQKSLEKQRHATPGEQKIAKLLAFANSAEQQNWTDLSQCVSQYAVCVYLEIANLEERIDALADLFHELQQLANFDAPLGAMEAAAVNPLPDFEAFMTQWRLQLTAIVENGHSEWENSEERWLREVTLRMDGITGLGILAKKSRNPGDFDAWCLALKQNDDWAGALAAYRMAVRTVHCDKTRTLARFYDGAALAAKQLGDRDALRFLKNAWLAQPPLKRLRCWLGAADTSDERLKIGKMALAKCPVDELAQRAFLLLQQSDVIGAARMVGSASGLGWSSFQHPGHSMVPLLCGVFENGEEVLRSLENVLESPSVDDFSGCTEIEGGCEETISKSVMPCPEPAALLQSVDDLCKSYGNDVSVQKAVLKELKKAARKRVQGIVGNQRRRHYGHAALLMTLCVRLDDGSDTRKWFDGLKQEYRCYPAFQCQLAIFNDN